MVYYVRLVKVPEVVPTKSKGAFADVLCLVLVRNDLGEVQYSQPTTLVATLFEESSGRSLCTKETEWQGNEWSAEMRVPVPKSIRSTKVFLKVECKTQTALRIESAEPTLYICPVQSVPFELKVKTQAESLAKRLCFKPEYKTDIALWELVGSTIAGHVWDAGVVFSAHMLGLGLPRGESDQTLQTPLSQLLLSAKTRTKPLQIIELGSGIGMVSIAAARALPNCNIVPSDVEDAKPLLLQNIEEARSSSKLLSKLEDPWSLDWGKLEERERLNSRVWDLILIADCTYNTSSIGWLVETISAAVKAKPVLVAVALKRRHLSEGIFFDKMEEANFGIVHHHIFKVPDRNRIELGMDEMEIELFQFRYRVNET